MATEIDATAGGATANSFVTMDYLVAYMAGRLNPDAFNDATSDDRVRALVEATRDLSARPWKGRRSTVTQALAWPRYWVIDPDSPNHDYFASTVVPERIKRATCEMALAFLKAGSTDLVSEDTSLRIKRKKVDVLETEYVEPYTRPKGVKRFPAVMREIRALLASSSGLNTPVVRS